MVKKHSRFLNTGLRSGKFLKRAILVLISVVLLLVAYLGITWLRPEVQQHVENSQEGDITHDVGAEDGAQLFCENLVKKGWTPRAAAAVCDLNRKYFQIVWQEAPDEWKSDLVLFQRLGGDPGIQIAIEKVPELAALLAGTLEYASDGPHQILDVLPKDAESRNDTIALLQLFAAPEEALAFCRIFKADKGLILRIWRAGAYDALAEFLKPLPTSSEVASEYRRWRQELFEPVLGKSQNELICLLVFLEIHRKQLIESLTKPRFRELFWSTYWPAVEPYYRECLNTDEEEKRITLWCEYLMDPRVWRYFEVFSNEPERAVKAYQQYGNVAVDISLDIVFSQIREKILDILRLSSPEVVMIVADQQLRKNPDFVAFLKRDLEPVRKAQALMTLKNLQPDEQTRRLAYWQTLSDSALYEELGPEPSGFQTWVPGFGVVYFLRKMAQGREVTVSDAVWGAGDLVALVPLGGAALKGSSGPLVQVLKKAGVRGAEEFVDSVTKNAAKRGISSLAVDVTHPTRYLFTQLKKSGADRRWFRTLTGLEARVFMRRDAVVLLDSTYLAKGPLGRFMKETAENAGFDKGCDVVSQVLTRGRSVTDEQMEALRQHRALWFLAAARRSEAADISWKDDEETLGEERRQSGGAVGK